MRAYCGNRHPAPVSSACDDVPAAFALWTLGKGVNKKRGNSEAGQLLSWASLRKADGAEDVVQ